MTVNSVKNSRYANLRTLVECKWPNRPVWETIAAFDSERIAVGYAQECFERATQYETGIIYRVVRHNLRRKPGQGRYEVMLP